MNQRTRFAQRIGPHVDAEMEQAHRLMVAGESDMAFRHLERAHVLGQSSTLHHVRVHCAMLRWGVAQRRPIECLGQVMRIVGAATKTALGWVPAGNTGGTDVSPFKPLPLPPDLASLIQRAHNGDL
jgi:Protein of unknown function (DUF3703)